MAYEAGTAYLSIIPSFKGGGRAIADELAGQMGPAGQRGGQQFAAGMGEGRGRAGFAATGAKLGGFFAAAFAAVGLGEVVSSVKDYLGEAVSAASDLAETTNKANVIFGQAAPAIEEWAASASTAAGLSKAAALDAAAGFGNMFSQLGFSTEETARLSTEVVQLSADLGSFNNLPTAEVADKISAAFRGEYDSLQALIPNINAARVEKEALAATGKTTAASLTAQEKAAAVLSIVYRDGAAAVGDFAATSDGLANSQKIVTAEMENLKTEVGAALLPVMRDLFGVFRDVGVPMLRELATWFTENQDEIRSFILISTDMGLMFAQATLTMIRIWAQFQDAFITIADNVLRFWFTVVGGIIDGAAQAFGWIPGVGDKLRQTQDRFRELRTTSEAQLGAMRTSADKVTQGIRAGESAVGELRGAVQKLDGFTANVRVKVNVDEYLSRIPGTAQYIAAQGRAHGGPVVAGRPYIVGERGPELIVPRSSGTVIDAGKTAKALGGGGAAVVFNGPVYNHDPRELAGAIVQRQRDAAHMYGLAGIAAGVGA